MKSIYVIILISLMSVSAYAQQAVFRLKNLSEMPLFFQPQDSGKFVTIEAKDTSFVSHLSRPRYYNVVVNGKDYVPVYCAPQCSTTITVEKDGRVIMDGTFKKENEPDESRDVDIQFKKEMDGGRNSNERILELHKAGKSNMAIAKELGLGLGEVKLVIDLFEGI